MIRGVRSGNVIILPAIVLVALFEASGGTVGRITQKNEPGPCHSWASKFVAWLDSGLVSEYLTIKSSIAG